MTRPRPTSTDAIARSSGQASALHSGIKHPTDEQALEERLDDADVASLGSGVEDEMRDRRGKGVAGEYDDSITHDADEHYPGPENGEPPAVK
ncbi:hypothetical protein [Cognatiluteimonas profundi]|uniref:hypothetical protein n=1 Tax=Cognatiluteimonas profundi TaxID=2594501 RepID=UPI00131E02F2|nr:hypothetical protein [Lysobacter profundi]